MVCNRLCRLALLAGVCLLALSLSSRASAALTAVHGAVGWRQETPPTGSLAKGVGLFSLDDSTGTLSYQLIFTDALLAGPETAAHIHGPAPPGVAAPVIFPLPLGSTISGTIPGLTVPQETDLESGLWYVNVHDATFPGGEIRGQLIPGLPIRIIVPEPSNLILATCGLMGLGFLALRKQL